MEGGRGSDGGGVMEGGDSGGGAREGGVMLGLSFLFRGSWSSRSHSWALVFIHGGGRHVLGARY